MTTTHPAPEEVMAWLDSEVDAEQAIAIAAHVQGCDDCRRVADQFRQLSGQLAAWDPGPASLVEVPGPSVWRRSSVRWAAVAALIVAAAAVGLRMRQGSAGVGHLPVTILVFIDWQCPSCLTTNDAYAPVVAQYAAKAPGSVRYVTKDYPLNADCNEYVSGRIHPAACDAAAAVRIAEARGKRAEFVQWLTGQGTALTAAAVRARVETSLGVTDFSAEYARQLPGIRQDTAEGHRLHVQFTPAVFVNGIEANDAAGRAPSAAELDRAIQVALEKSGRACADTRAC